MSALLCLVMEWFDPHVSQDAKVARAASHHCPEQIIITVYQLVGRGMFAGKMLRINSVNENLPTLPLWFPYRDMSGWVSVSVRQHNVEAFNVIREKTKASAEHPVTSSLDMASKMDVSTNSSWSEHSPLGHHTVVLQSIKITNRQAEKLKSRDMKDEG